jgi:aryl-alcohol dehydrogenase-like predicted oxidoreductase
MEAAKRLGVPPPVSIQNDFSLLDRRFEGETAEACHYANVGLLPYGPLAGGTLTDENNFGDEPPATSRHVLFPGFQPRYHSARSRAAAAEYAALAKAQGLTTAQLALAWCASRWYVHSTIIGATSVAQLEENLSAFDIELSDEVLAAVDAVHLEHRNPNVLD